MSCVVLLALTVLSCLCCCGVMGKKTCWYDFFRYKMKKNRAAKGPEPEIYQAMSEIAEKTGLPPSKVKTYVEVLEKHDIYSKDALFILTREELDNIA